MRYLLNIVCLLLAMLALVSSSVPPAVLKDGTYNYPAVDPPSTPGIMPGWGVQLEEGAENIVDLTFGTDTPGATIKSVNELGNVVYFYDFFGNPDSTRDFPVCGIFPNFVGTYSFYNEFLANGSRNPLALHQVLKDRLRLVARTNQSGSLPGLYNDHKWEIGYIRLPTQFKPGMVAELRVAPGGWPTSNYSWPTFWAFSGVQLPLVGGKNNRTRWYVSSVGAALENDFFDGYIQDAAGNQGASIPNGTPVYSDGSSYNYTDDLFMVGPGKFSFQSSGGGGSGVVRMNIPSEYDPVNASNPGLTVLAEWTDSQTLKYYVNGELVRIRYANYTAAYSNLTGYDFENNPPPDDLINTLLPMFIMVSHQFGATFNTIDLARLMALKEQVIANYDIQSIRIWNKVTTYIPPNNTPTIPLPAPVTGTTLGDLPEISSGTYVMNVEPVNGVMMDHFGAKVNLMGANPYISKNNANLNGRDAAIVQFHEAVSITGPAISYAQNGGNYMIFQVASNRAPNALNTNVIYMQMIRNYPMTDTYLDKPTVYMTPPQDLKLVARLESSVTEDLSMSNSSYVVQQDKPVLVMLNQSLGIDGTVTVGLGVQNSYYTPAIGKGVPAGLLDGYTELLLGSGRNKYNVLTNGANLLIGQTIMIAFEQNKTLSDTDLKAIRGYLAKKWGISLNDSLITKSPCQLQLQPTNYKPPAKSLFTPVDASSLAVDGGSTSPLTFTLPPSVTNNTAMLLEPLPSVNTTITALIKFNNVWSSSKTPGKFESMNGGLVLRSNATATVATFGIHFQNERSGGYRAYWYKPGALKNDSWLTPAPAYATESRKWYAAAQRNVWIRLVYSPAQTTFMGSVTGRANEWDTLFVTNNAFNYDGTRYELGATHFGLYMNSVSPPNFAYSARMSVLHMDVDNFLNLQGSPTLFTNDFVVTPTTATIGSSSTTTSNPTSSSSTDAGSTGPSSTGPISSSTDSGTSDGTSGSVPSTSSTTGANQNAGTCPTPLIFAATLLACFVVLCGL